LGHPFALALVVGILHNVDFDCSLRMKYLLTKSDDGHIVIAEVPTTHKKSSEHEFFVSRDCIEANIKHGTFTDITDKVDWGGKVWMLTSDMT